MAALRNQYGIPREAEIQLGSIELVINGRKLCELTKNGYIGAKFVTNKQHVDFEYKPKFEKPPVSDLFYDYRMFVFQNSIISN